MNEKLMLYSISDQYISYLRNDPLLKNVFDNKENMRSHTRKYVGVVISKNGYNYFVPFSSPKDSDYVITDGGTKEVRKSIIPIIRITTTDTISGNIELKGTLKISNMIPVPQTELAPYDINLEADSNYKMIVKKEYAFIQKNANLIIKNAGILYNQKKEEAKLYPDEVKKPGYLKSTVPFKYAESKCLEYCRQKNAMSPKDLEISSTGTQKPSIHERIERAEKEIAQRAAEHPAVARPTHDKKPHR